MKLSQILETLDQYQISSGAGDFEVAGVTCNSQKVKAGYIFVALRGVKFDGAAFVSEVIERGALAVIAENFDDSIERFSEVIFIKVADARKAMAYLAASFQGNPSKQLKVVGVTGTNGKTTVTYLIEAILAESKRSCAVIGTVNYRFNGRVSVAKNTTPGPEDLQELFSRMRAENVEYVAMEVSSHALAQERTAAVVFHSAIFTNLTQDHLDYHRDMEDYFKAKALLFTPLLRESFAVLNNDDIHGRRLKEMSGSRVITYGIDTVSDYKARAIEFGISGTSFVLDTPGGSYDFRMKLIGKHNVYNVLAAVAWGKAAGMSIEVIQKAVEQFLVVPGRLEQVETHRGFSVFVDYAHTDDALKNVITSLRQIAGGKIIVVFGCGGERDKLKRPKMGAVVTELADYAVITSDNPRSEDPLMILQEIKKGITKDNYVMIPDRKEAIRRAFLLASLGDMVLLTGKGHEDYQILKDNVIHFDDREVAKECLRLMT